MKNQIEKPEEKRSLEKEFFLRGPKSLNIKELLQIPPEFRSFQHCKEIINHIKVMKSLRNKKKEFRKKDFKKRNFLFQIYKRMEESS